MLPIGSPATAIVHIGTHKTGTTSIQTFVQREAVRLREVGIAPYLGERIGHNHVELHLAAMRLERLSGYKVRHGVTVDAEFIRHVCERIERARDATTAHTMLFSAEGLSLLRHRDEIDRLLSMLPFDRVRIVVALRNAADFLASYRAQIGDQASEDPVDFEHYNYLGPDSWITDFAPRLALWQAAVGTANVEVIDYDRAVAEDGSILPAFLAAIGASGVFPDAALRLPFLNARSPAAGDQA
jgi:hypothetical protein